MSAMVKLSDAILAGCALIPEGPEYFFTASHGMAWIGRPEDGPVPACADAMGTALIARAGSWERLNARLAAKRLSVVDALEVCWPWLKDTALQMCECPPRHDWMMALAHVQDQHGWRREQVGEWLRSRGL